MTTQNISRQGGRHKKRDVSVMVSSLDLADLATSADVYQLGQLPARAIIVSAHIDVLTANDAGTSGVVDIGFDGGAELFDDLDLQTTGVTASSLAPLSIETGGTLTALPTYVGTASTAGEAVLTVEYIEYDQCTGELTNFVE